MNFRALFMVLATFTFAQPVTAHAQVMDAAPTAAELEAGRDIMTLMLVDSNAMPLAVEMAFGAQGNTIRAAISSAPFFAGLPSVQQGEALAFVDRLPAIALEELNRAMPAVLDAGAQRYAAHFTEQEMLDIRAYMRSPGAEDYMKRSVLYGVIEEIAPGTVPVPQPSAAELAAETAFLQTSTGIAFTQRQEGATQAMVEAIETGFASLGPIMQTRTRDGLCETLGPYCPADLRN